MGQAPTELDDPQARVQFPDFVPIASPEEGAVVGQGQVAGHGLSSFHSVDEPIVTDVQVELPERLACVRQLVFNVGPVPIPETGTMTVAGQPEVMSCPAVHVTDGCPLL